MVPIKLGIRQDKLLPFVLVSIEGFHCEDECVLMDCMNRIMDIAEQKQAVFISSDDLPPINYGMRIQICFTALFQTMSDASSFVKEILKN